MLSYNSLNMEIVLIISLLKFNIIAISLSGEEL